MAPLKVTRARFVWDHVHHVLIQRVRAEEFGALFKLGSSLV